MLSRFTWIVPLLIFVVGCQTPPPPAPQTPPILVVESLPILQGTTDQTSTIISVMVPAVKNYSFSVHLDKTMLRSPTPVEIVHSGFEWKIVNLTLTNLSPGATYTLKIANQGEIVDERHFKTLAKDLKTPKIAVISCTDDHFSEVQKKQWELVTKQSPDMLFLIGDNVYIDTNGKDRVPVSSENDIWRRYQETRLHLDLYKLKTLIPVYATWDDHDFGQNNGTSNFPFKDHSKEIFQTFFPTIETKSLQKGPGVSHYFEHNKHHYLFLDDRFFRAEKNQPNGTHFGKEQEEWLLKIIGKQKGAFWLISGDQFFGGYHTFESYEGDHPDSFKSFLNKLKEKKKIVVFVSGDRHIAELMKIPPSKLGYTTFELTSSGLHAKMFPGSLKDLPNSLAVFNKDGEFNFLMLKPGEASKFKMNADVQFLGENGRSLYNGELEIKR